MTQDAQLEWERRNGRWAAAAAALSIVFLIAGTAYRLAAVPAADNDRELLRLIDEQGSDFVISGVLQGLSLLFLAGVLVYLYRVIRHRRPEMHPVALVVGVLGPVLLASGSVLLQLDRIEAADEFFASGSRTEGRAEDQLREVSVASQVTGGAGQLSTAIAFVLIGLNGLRSGVLSRFMGVLGVIIGGLYVLPLVPGGQLILQVFWLGALALLFLDRWPGGRGPAWETGEPDPWPSTAERRGLGSPPEEPDPEAARAEQAEQPVEPAARKKKKRKKRR